MGVQRMGCTWGQGGSVERTRTKASLGKWRKEGRQQVLSLLVCQFVSELYWLSLVIPRTGVGREEERQHFQPGNGAVNLSACLRH